MKVFSCQVCGQILYFENTRCESCGHQLGYLPDKVVLSALKPKGVVWTALANPALDYRRCQNHEFDTCNWLLPAQGKETLCAACRHNRTIPDLSEPENLELWRKMEFAKHRLIYTLLELGLPLINQVDAPKSRLAFEFLRESKTPHGQRVSTGHDNGTITVALDEADDAKREQVRTQMGEPYRTLLGHFRHEVGHYFWNILVRDGGRLETFRDVFGREDIDYSGALQLHYSNGPPADWQSDFVSAYASTHPWEDFAETWAHYLHIVDTLETARSFGMKVHVLDEKEAAVDFDPHNAPAIEHLVEAWLPLCFTVNSLNRSMGLGDLYPFILSPKAIGKLNYVHELIRSRRHDCEISGNNANVNAEGREL